MDAYETLATVEANGQVRLGGLPFAPGTQVEVTVNPKRGLPEDFLSQWQRVTEELRARNGAISDEEIQNEIDNYRRKA